MRIISGAYRGRKLISSKDLSIRPATDRVKEYIFNVLGDFQTNKKVVDIFSGSGSLGLEALSRGAAEVVFVEKARSSINVLKENISNLAVSDDLFEIKNLDAIEFAKQNKEQFGLYLLDPPFIYPPLQELINTITSATVFRDSDILVVEHETTNPLKEEGSFYKILKQKKFGRSIITFLIKKEKDEQ